MAPTSMKFAVYDTVPRARHIATTLVLNGLSQGFEVGAAEFWKLAQEQ